MEVELKKLKWTVEEQQEPDTNDLLVRVSTFANGQKYAAVGRIRRFSLSQPINEEVRKTAIALRDGLEAKISQDEEERELNLTP
jgi:hypothetical protein